MFDFVPMGEPFVMTDRHRAAMQRGLERELPVTATIRAMMEDRLAELRESPAGREAVRSLWKRAGVDAVQVTLGALELAPSDWDAWLRDLGYWHERARAGTATICATGGELRAAHRDATPGIVLGTQDAAPVGRDLQRFQTLRRLGVRVVQLTYNLRNQFGDGCTERAPAGLSRAGIDAVRVLDEVGMVIDVSHCSTPTAFDAIDLSSQPVAVTHASCEAVAPHPRAKSDDLMRALRDCDGYMGIVAVPFFLRPTGSASLEDLVRHVAHAVSILGAERVGIATDWGGWSPDMPTELAGAARRTFERLGFRSDDIPEWGVSLSKLTEWTAWPRVTEALVAAGFGGEEVRGLIGGNFLSYLERLDAAGP